MLHNSRFDRPGSRPSSDKRRPSTGVRKLRRVVRFAANEIKKMFYSPVSGGQIVRTGKKKITCVRKEERLVFAKVRHSLQRGFLRINPSSPISNGPFELTYVEKFAVVDRECFLHRSHFISTRIIQSRSIEPVSSKIN